MVTFLSIMFALLFSTLFMANVGIAIKEAEKSVFLGEVDEYTWYVTHIKAPTIFLLAIMLDLFKVMVSGIMLLFSENYRAGVIAEELLFEEVEEE